MKIKLKTTKAVLIAVLLSSITAIFLHTTSSAQEQTQQDREVVVLLDCSKSMEDVDSQYLAFDFVKGLAASLPRNCRMGFTAYNNGVCASLPIGSSSTDIGNMLSGLQYRQYGNAGAGLAAAVACFQNNQADKQILLISDGEIMMDTKEGTEESNELFEQSVAEAKKMNIAIDVLAMGERIQEGHTVYAAAGSTEGTLYEVEDSMKLCSYIEKYLSGEWETSVSHVGKLDGTKAELTVSLPDCIMEKAKILLIGSQQNENMTLSGKAGRMDLSKGRNYTVVDIANPVSEHISIQMSSDTPMQVDAYLYTEYEYTMNTGYLYEENTQTAHIWVELANTEGHRLLDGHLGNGEMALYLDGQKTDYTISEGKAWIENTYSQSSTAHLEVRFMDPAGNYYGIREAEEEITVPVVEKEEETDWFFWSVIGLFIIAVAGVFGISYKKRKGQQTIRRQVADLSSTAQVETAAPKNDFCGKIVVYVIHNKNDIDYPPESINLFARCRRESITLEWILDTCNLPLDLKGAEKIIFKPGADRSLVVKNNSRASVLIGRALLTKGQSYNLYYHEKVTFIFDQEDAEIEVHYKDLKPNER